MWRIFFAGAHGANNRAMLDMYSVARMTAFLPPTLPHLQECSGAGKKKHSLAPVFKCTLLYYKAFFYTLITLTKTGFVTSDSKWCE